MTLVDPRLPTDVVPRHYDLELVPDLDAGTFAGRVAIDVEIRTPTRRVVANAAELAVDEAAVVVEGESRPAAVELDADAERVVLVLDEDLPVGPARVELAFRGELNDRLAGFYRSTYTADDGTSRTIATTQFQSTDARRAFPCWDEPALKATFAVTLVVDDDLLAVSNTGEIARTAVDDGRVSVRFATTMPMSTYLVAFVVGPLEVTDPVDVDGVPVRVVHRPGRGDQTAFALDVAAHALRWFADWYGIAYPSDKVDLVAIPDFAFGAMENLGCVTFREVLLLVDPATASQPELQRVADVIDHELAHMWFGDLVTMRWWEGIWLNEAFATFMETACTDAYRPDWDVWTTFARARAAALETDALATTRPIEYPVVTPADAEGMFDILTYEKGASIVRMLERYLGEDRFRAGVGHYLRTHAHGNTDTGDLWDAIETTTGEPVRRTMDGWILQGGHPLLELVERGGTTLLRQRHHTLDPAAADDRRWVVPVRLAHRRDGVRHELRVLLDADELPVEVAAADVLTLNVEGAGFHRSRPSDAVLADPTPVLGLLDAAERHGLVDDTWALTVGGTLEAERFRHLARAFTGETDLTVWQALATGLAGLDRLLDDGPARDRHRREVAALAGPALARSGTRRRPGDDDRTRELRATLLRLLGRVAHDPEVVAGAHDLLADDDPTVAAAALDVVAAHGDRAVRDRIADAWRSAADPQTEQRHLRALADLPDPELVLETLAGTLDGTIRNQDGPYLIARALTNRRAGPAVWDFVETRWDHLLERFPSNSIDRMLSGITALWDAEVATRVAAFLAERPVPSGQRQVDQSLELLAVHVAFRRREAARFATAR